MSRGLGIEQRGILLAAATKPDKWWRRVELQQAAWGQRRPDYDLYVPEGEKGGAHRWIKNVRWWRDGKQLSEGNFTRSILSLENRNLLIRKRYLDRHWPDDAEEPIEEWVSTRAWKITEDGLAEAERLCPTPNRTQALFAQANALSNSE